MDAAKRGDTQPVMWTTRWLLLLPLLLCEGGCVARKAESGPHGREFPSSSQKVFQEKLNTAKGSSAAPALGRGAVRSSPTLIRHLREAPLPHPGIGAGIPFLGHRQLGKGKAPSAGAGVEGKRSVCPAPRNLWEGFYCYSGCTPGQRPLGMMLSLRGEDFNEELWVLPRPHPQEHKPWSVTAAYRRRMTDALRTG